MIRFESNAARTLLRLSVLVIGLVAGPVLTGSVARADGAAGQRGWYTGIGTGLSRLTPDTGASALTLDDDTSTAIVGWVGRDLGRRLSLEAALSDLGDAKLDGGSIGYRAASIGVLGHLLGNSERIARRDGTSLYLRAGLSVIDNASDLDLEQADNTAVWAGIGVDRPVTRRWGLRGEVTSYDGDAQAAWLGVYARLRGAEGAAARRGPVRPSTPAPPAAPAPVPSPTASPEPRSVPVPEPLPRPSIAPPAELPVATPSPGCVSASPGEPLDPRGCALFAGVLDGVDFLGATDRLTPVAERSLERLAGQLVRHPGTVVEIRAHVAPMLTEAAAQRLSRERALAVARRLAAAGVPVTQLRARAFGDRQPPAPGAGTEQRSDGARIEIAVPR